MTSLPPCRLLFRSKEGVELFTLPSERSEEKTVTQRQTRDFLLKGATTFQALHPNGSAAFVHRPDVGIFKLSLLEEDDNSATAATTPFLKETGRVQIMDISPQGTYLLTWERPPEGETPNLKLWSSTTGEMVAGFRQKVLRKDNWPYLQWTHDESFAFLLGTNEIKVYPGSTFAIKTEEGPRFVDRLKMPGISSLSVPSQSPSAMKIFFTTFSPKDKNRPAKAAFYEYPAKTTAEGGANDPYPAVASKSLFQAEEMSVQWNPKGDVALISLQTNVDTSGQSYYGSTSLFLMSHDQTDAITVPLPQEGPVLDVAWVPNPSNKGTASAFVVVAGKMPSMASLHNGSDGKATFVFGNAHRNTIAWAPHGRFLCLAGFGNLAGGMTFWDRNKLKQVPPGFGVTASCTVGYGWSPDSRMFAVSTTSPRMNVDNGVRVFRYNGDQVMNVSWKNDNYLPDRLLQVSFLPALPTVYPDRPQSPTLKDAVPGAAGPAEVTAAPKSVGAYVPPSARVAYVPPSARGGRGAGIGGRGGGSTLADRLRAEKESSMKGAGKVVEKPKLVVGATGKVIPGLVVAAPAQQGKSKSAQKKEKVKQKKEEEEAKRILEEKAAAAVAPPPASEDPQKKARKINKILKQIDELKQKAASELNDDQKKKIDSEAELRQELSSLAL